MREPVASTLRWGSVALACSILSLAGCKPSGSGDGQSSAAPSASSTTASASAELKSLTVDEVDQRIASNDPSFKVFDCNDKETYAANHVPTATWVPSNAVTADMLPSDKGTTLVFYCSNEH